MCHCLTDACVRGTSTGCKRICNPVSHACVWGNATGFRSRQGPYLRRIWNLEFDDHDTLTALQPYSLSSLYACKPAKHRQASFLSAAVKHMSSLALLSLRGYTHLDLQCVPVSVSTLQIGPAVVMKPLSHK